MKKLLLLLLCLASTPAWTEPGPSMLGNEIMAKRDWAGDVGKCPVDLFAPAGRQEYNGDVRALCDDPSGQSECLANCTGGKGESCYWLATALQKSVSETNAASEILFQRACKLGIASGCTNRAAGMMPEPPLMVNAKSCPARTFERTCAANDAWGCAMYGKILSEDKSIPLNKERALEVLTKACRFDERDPACRAANSLKRKLQP